MLHGEGDPSSFLRAATPSHVSAATDALREVCELVTVHQPPSGSKPIYIRFGHFEHGSFLSPLLFGFPIMTVTGRNVDVPPRLSIPTQVQDRVDTDWHTSGMSSYLATAKTTTGFEVLTPDASSSDDPFTYAIVANSSVDLQVNVALTALASLLSRGEVAERLLESQSVENLGKEIENSDQHARQSIADAVRIRGWRAAATEIRDRSRVANRPIVAAFGNPIFDSEQLAARVPAMRRVYNENDAIRLAIDKVATLMSQGMTIVGPGTDQVMRMSLDMLDVGAVRTFLAHLSRDAFVCGNGYLSFGQPPESALRLIAPEGARLNDSGNSVQEPGSTGWTRVLHIRGAEQVGSKYGLGMLEPFIAQIAQRDALIRKLYAADCLLRWDRTPPWAKALAETDKKAVPQLIRTVESQMQAALGSVTEGLTEPPQELFFPGHERMEPAPTFFLHGGVS